MVVPIKILELDKLSSVTGTQICTGPLSFAEVAKIIKCADFAEVVNCGTVSCVHAHTQSTQVHLNTDIFPSFR